MCAEIRLRRLSPQPFAYKKLGKEHIGKVSIQKKLFAAMALIMALLLAGCSAIGSSDHRGSLDVDYIANGDEGEDRLNQLKGLAAENTTSEPENKLRTPAPVDGGDDEDTASVGRAQAEARDNEITSEAVQTEQTAAPVSSKEPEANTCTITIRCDTAVAKGMHLEKKWQGIVPASGEILKTTTMTFEQGDTVFDVLCAVRDKYKLHMEYSGAKGNEYIEGINNLYEFDGGRWSGWMYCVNDWYPNYGCGQYVVKSGDVIEWNYTCDLGKDLGQTWLAG